MEDVPIHKPTLRDFCRVRRVITDVGSELMIIRNKGFAAVTSATDRTVFQGMCTTVDDLFLKLNDKWEEALDMAELMQLDSPFPSLEDKKALRDYKTAYYEIRSYHVQIQARTDPGNISNPFEASNVSRNLSIASTTRVMLPKIDIPPYHGDLTKFPSFKQLFISLVKEEPSLSTAEKFFYLISFLRDEALETIKHFPPVAENFEQAWQLLVRTYDDPRKLASTYLERFLNYKPHVGKPTAESLQAYLSNVTESIVSLRNLNIENLAEYLLCELALRSLDPVTREAFETSIIGTIYPQFNALQTFVQNRRQVLRITQGGSTPTEFNKPLARGTKPPNKYSSQPFSRHALMAQGELSPVEPSNASLNRKSCFFCQQGHKLTECPRFRSASPGARLEMLQHFEGCRNCLYVGHRTNSCPSPFSCRWCNMRHHSDLHLPTQPAAPTEAPSGNQRPNSPSTSGFAGASTDQRSGVLLGTVVAAICNARGQQRTFRGVLDPGSQFSFITEDCARKLTLTVKPFRGAIAGVNQSPLCHVRGIVSVGFVSPLAETFRTEAIVVPSITPPLPQVALRSTRWEEYRAYPLSDTRFDEPGPISFLIGADLYPEIVIGRPIALFDASPRLMETVFGFTIIGRFYEEAHPHGAVALMAQTDLKTLVERFWQLEEPSSPGSLEEEPCEEFFLQTHYRTGDGRYVVRLPFKTTNPPINPNINRVLNCFRSLENRLAKDELLQSEYADQMREYLHLGHMRPASGPPRYVLPHHAVVKEVGEQRKVRVVFDASFPSASGSLNDHLLTGPKLQADLADILLNFRRFPFVFTCDIVKMFRQILVDPADRPYLQIAWRFAAHEPVSMYELTTVTFGLSCSPYLAQRVLRQHATNYQRQYPEAAAVILQNTYIDDITGGADSVEELCRLKTQLVELLLRGGFELSKWGSNHPSLLADDLTAGGAISWGPADLQTTKILGMKWEPQSDVFSYDIHSPPQSSTKRSILSVIARLYDPLGYLAPVIFLAKSIFQHTWRADTTWDSEVPSEIKTVWLRFIGQLPSLSAISIPRPLPKSSEPPMLVGFCDASALGYCAAAYLRTTSTTGTRLTLLRAKTRLAPIKTLTIPRLELCGALLLGQLIASLSRLRHELDVQQVFCFTDSMTVLAWLRSPPHRLQVFVANRVQQVLMVTNADWWYHVQGSENPADVGSRGISPERLREHHLWWTGPSWALKPLDEWPISDSVEISELPETKPNALTLNVTLVRPHLIDMAARHSKYPRMIRSMAYANRFIWNTRALRTNQARRKGAITATEFQTAETTYVRVLQRFYYAEFYGKPFNELPLELRRLSAFLDESDIIRVGGRLRNASISFEQKHPILLPKHSAFTRLVIDYYHLQNHHAGPATIIAAIQLRYWIPGVRNTIKTVKRKCATCARFSRSSVIPFMGDLPKSRFAGVRAFLITGVDFAGPFIHKLSKLRNARTEKAYLCLFICMSSRAVHLEVATGLSVEAFLDAFDRFVWRRGLPQEMLSDGGTNFRGADNYLRELAKTLNSPVARDQLMDRTAPRGVKWNFNPPSSPHFGGGWEVAIRMVKELLSKTFGAQAYTLPELTTAFTKIEGIINSRPLQPLSADPEDLEPLTPGHFLVGQPLTSLPEPNYQHIPTNRLNRWQQVQERVQYFWSRWQVEYLASLQLRAKWDRHAPNLRVGDLVLIRDTAAPPAQWPLGRIQEVHPGSDDIVRVVTVRTSGGTYRRPAVKMIPLRLGDLHE